MIAYPFLFTKLESEENYLACDIDSCFGYDQEFEKVKEIINKRIQ